MTNSRPNLYRGRRSLKREYLKRLAALWRDPQNTRPLAVVVAAEQRALATGRVDGAVNATGRAYRTAKADRKTRAVRPKRGC